MALQADVREKDLKDCHTAGLEDGGRGHKLGSAGNLWKLERATKDSRASRRNTALLILQKP